ncbi:MAG: class I SAM-dependent methyltransferase, partial [Pseudomonadota bacterium]
FCMIEAAQRRLKMTTQALSLNDMKPTLTNTDKSRRFWDRHAPKYAKSKISDLKGYERSLERTRDYLTRDQNVLEIGCGTGKTAIAHAPFAGHITGTDIASGMVEIAREKASKGGPLNLDFLPAPADDLGFPAATFDLAMSHNLYHLVDDVDAALKEAHRVLKSGSIFISKTPCLGEMNVVMRRLVLPLMTQFYGLGNVQMFTQEQWLAALERAGFAIEAIEFHGTKGKDNRPFIMARAQ